MPPEFINTDDPKQLLAIVATQMQLLSKDMGDMKSAQDRMADAIGQLAVFEERQTTTIDSVGRAFKSIEKLDEKYVKLEIRVRALESSDVTNSKTSKWIEAAILGLGVVLFQYFAKRVGL